MKLVALFSVLIILIQPFYCSAGENETIVKLNDIPHDGRLLMSFAAELYNRGEYYRAITEFYRFNSYYPDTSPGNKTGFLIGESYSNAEKWGDAIKSYRGFISDFGNDELVQDAEYKLLYSCIQKGDYDEAEKIYERLENSNAKHKWSDEIRYLNILNFISRYEWEKSIKEINGYLEEKEPSKYETKYRTLLKELPKYKSIPEKSFLKAGILSAMLPGAGQFYVRRNGDGIMAFLLTTISLATSMNCYANNADVGAVVFGLFTVSFYSANIYNAMNGAHKFNAEAERNFYLKIVDIAKEKHVFWSLNMQVSPATNSLILKHTF